MPCELFDYVNVEALEVDSALPGAPEGCSQNAAYSPTTMAAHIRSANSAESGNPTIVTVRRTLCTRVIAIANHVRRHHSAGLDGPSR
jgi:hypothetical protein